jgi:NAD(P)H-dependent flavin oxidoreductase YrpB (nitropropane dioxygenase family)
MWPDRKIIEMFGIEHPILLAPMAGPSTAELAIAVSEAGGLGSFGSALSTNDDLRAVLGVIRQRTLKPINLNFFTHVPPDFDAAREARWKERLAPYYAEHGLNPDRPGAALKPRPLYGRDVRHRRGIQTRGRRLSLRPAARAAVSAGAARRIKGNRLGDDGTRSEVASRAWLRCHHRSRLRGRRPSRHVSY